MILIYGAESWTWTKAGINRLTEAEVRFVRIIGGKTEREKIGHESFGS